MSILKTLLKVVFLVLLCVPIIYIEYYIVKDTLSGVIKAEKKKPSKTNNTINNYYREEYLKAAK